MPDAAGRLRQLIGSHTAGGHWDDGAPMSVHQVLGEATVGELAATVHDDQIAPLQAERDQARRHLIDSAGFDVADLMHSLDDCIKRAEQAEAALVEIRDRHRRHGDLSRYLCARADRCEACREPWPCQDRQTAERGLGEVSDG